MRDNRRHWIDPNLRNMTDFDPNKVEYDFERQSYPKALFKYAPEVCISDFERTEQQLNREDMNKKDMAILGLWELDEKMRKWQEADQEEILNLTI